MAINESAEQLITFKQAAALPVFRNPNTGKACHISLIYRYADGGVQRADGRTVVLDSIRTPSLRTSVEAVQRFIDELNDRTPTPVVTRTRRQAIQDAERELDEAGVK